MPLKTHLDDQPSLNMTPMIDIVFLLIIFFMVGTKFTELHEAEQSIPLKVPTVSDGGTLSSAPQKRIINVYRDGSVALDKEQMTLDQLDSRLREAVTDYPKMGIIVRGDADGRFQNVADVLARCRSAGISNFAISVQLQTPQTANRSGASNDGVTR